MTAEVAQQGVLYCPTCERTFTAGERCPNDNTRFVRLTGGARDTLIGRDLDGRYTIVEKIGQGGMGAVYRGTQHSVGRDVAIKVVSPRLMSDDVVIKRFLREAKLASRLSHPNAVSVLDFGQTDDQLFYLVMELVVGRTLDEVLTNDGVMSPERVVRIGSQICDALEGAHTLNVIHRDLKPANIMLLSTGRDLVKVLDFGLARSLTKEAGMTTMTSEGMVLGTPAFMPPEAVGASSGLDGRSDLYSLGCVLYNAASGHPPFGGTTLHELVAMHLTEPPPPLVNIPDGLWTVLERLLAKMPDLRYPTARSARDALDACLVESPDALVPTVVAVEPSAAVSSPGQPAVALQSVAAPPPELMQTVDVSTERDFGKPSSVPAPRKRWPLITGGVAVVALAAVGAFALLGGGGKHHESKPRAPKSHGESGAAEETKGGATSGGATSGGASSGGASTGGAVSTSGAASGGASTGSASTGSASTGGASTSGTASGTATTSGTASGNAATGQAAAGSATSSAVTGNAGSAATGSASKAASSGASTGGASKAASSGASTGGASTGGASTSGTPTGGAPNGSTTPSNGSKTVSRPSELPARDKPATSKSATDKPATDKPPHDKPHDKPPPAVTPVTGNPGID